MEIKSGFSLIELVVVIGLISLLSLAMSAIMLSTIVSSNRVRNLTAIKQAGDYASNQIQTMIRNSRAILTCDQATNTVVIENHDGETTTITGDTALASNSASLLPSDLTVSGFSLTCTPSVGTRLTTFSFNLAKTNPSVQASENPTLHFQFNAELRNE